MKGVNNGAATLRLLVFFGSLPKIEKADCGSRKHGDHYTLIHMYKDYLRNGKLDISGHVYIYETIRELVEGKNEIFAFRALEMRRQQIMLHCTN